MLTSFLISTVLACASFAQVQYRWWVTTTFEPRGSELEGIPVSVLDPSWVAASKLTDDLLPQAATVANSGGAFEVSGDFSGDGFMTKAIVGVYRTSSDEVGQFLLFLAEGPAGNWSKRSVIKNPGRPGFSILREHESRLEWWFCVSNCDHMCSVVAAESGFECHFPHIGPEGPCTNVATESGLECRRP